ncbi:hypothetical protein DIPPA_00991, partial [Diplonema papillatum]
MVALSYECSRDEERAKSAFENARPGQLVMVPPPKYIIVDVNGKQVPVERSRGSEEPVKKRAFTFWRCQGLTLRNVVIDLHRRPPALGKITFEAFYVAVSRVRSPENLYLLPEREEGAFDWVAKKTPPPDFIAWLRSRCPGRYPDVPQQKKAAPKRSSAPARKKPAAKLSAAAKRAASDQPAGPPPAKKPAAKLSAKRAGGHHGQKRAKPAEGPAAAAAAAADASSNPAASSSSSARPPPAAKKPAAKHPAAAKRAASSCQPGQKKAKFAEQPPAAASNPAAATSSSAARRPAPPPESRESVIKSQLHSLGLTWVPVAGDCTR